LLNGVENSGYQFPSRKLKVHNLSEKKSIQNGQQVLKIQDPKFSNYYRKIYRKQLKIKSWIGLFHSE
jgi:hypothetical protein